MINSLVIGNTSQLSHYFPNEYVKISSRDIDFNHITDKKWDKIFICIGESRKFIQNIDLYDQINFNLTLEIINKLKNHCNSIVVYSTCELWNQYDGQIHIDMSFNFFMSPYLQSKYKLSKYILNNKEDYHNVFIVYPFNFNSIYRNNNFLFGKIFDSIINKKQIEIGDTYFYRDIIHPKFVVNESTNITKHKIVGSGRLTFVNDFIRDLYKHFNMVYEEYVFENFTKFKEYEKNKEYYLKSNNCTYHYKELLSDTIGDINRRLI